VYISSSNTSQKKYAMNTASVVTVSDRAGLNFYALEVPAGEKFESARQEAKRLSAAGFSEARVGQ
jgi:hypothetical protein